MIHSFYIFFLRIFFPNDRQPLFLLKTRPARRLPHRRTPF
jgi:hypothetical protein